MMKYWTIIKISPIATQMLSHSKYITLLKELNGSPHKKRVECLACLIPARIHPVIMPGVARHSSLGSFKCFKNMGQSTFIISPGSSRKKLGMLKSTQKKLKWFLWSYTTQLGDSRWEFIDSGSAPTYPEPEDLNRSLETLMGVSAWIKPSEERLANSQDVSPFGRIISGQRKSQKNGSMPTQKQRKAALTSQRWVHTSSMHL